MTSAPAQKIENERPLYYDEALRLLPLKEFVRRQFALPHRRPRFQTPPTRSVR